MAKAFAEWLVQREFKKSLKAQTTFSDLVKSLDEVVKGIHDNVPHKDITVSLEPGMTVNQGQQYRVMLSTKDGTFNVPLFRAYVALDGSKVYFDFYDEKQTVVPGKQDDIFDAVSSFLVRPTTVAQFQQLADHLDRKKKRK
jgi:hypothetical protein